MEKYRTRHEMQLCNCLSVVLTYYGRQGRYRCRHRCHRKFAIATIASRFLLLHSCANPFGFLNRIGFCGLAQMLFKLMCTYNDLASFFRVLLI